MNYKSLQRAITRDDKHSIESRWAYGRAVILDPKKMAASGKSLRHGAIEALIADAKAVGTKLTEREIQRRIQCARAYKTINEIRHAVSEFDTWHDIVDAGFPTVDVDEPDVEPDEMDGLGDEPEYEQLTLIPGAPEVLRIRGRSVKLDEATLAEFKAYCQQSAEITANFAKRDAQLWAAYDAMREVTDDPNANAVKAWQRATGKPETDVESAQDAA